MTIRWIPLDEVPRLEAYLSQTIYSPRKVWRRDAVACILGLHGLRVSEVVNTQIRDLDVANARLNVRTIKNGIDRQLPMDLALVQRIASWRGCKGGPKSPLVPSTTGNPVTRQQLNKACRRFTEAVFDGKASYHFHVLRHTAAMRMYAQTLDIRLTQKFLGHRKIETTLVYADTLNSVPLSALPRLHQMGLFCGPDPSQNENLHHFQETGAKNPARSTAPRSQPPLAIFDPDQDDAVG